MKAQIQKRGDSFDFRLSNVEQDSFIDLSVFEDEPIADRTEFTLEQLLEGVSTKNAHREIDTGNRVGREIW